MSEDDSHSPAARRPRGRRDFIRNAAAGTAIVALGGAVYALTRDEETEKARSLSLPDGRPRLPQGQRLIHRLKDMGGILGDPSLAHFQLNVRGECDHPLELGYAALLKMPHAEQRCDVHCVTGWSVFDSRWQGIPMTELATLARVRPSARYVIFEAAGGYTTNVPIEEALRPNAMVAYRLDGDPLAAPNGAPVRALVPSLYFWKSAKWLTAIRFSTTDAPGYWETRGYHNHADPWREERYS